MIRVPSADGLQIALHHLGGVPDAPPVLISHATGFHAHCYTPVADRLSARFHVVALDHRGHGESPIAAEWDVDWRRFGDDALAAARHVAPEGGLVGFGHSMGGASLLMAAHREPALFERLVLFEPISHEASTPPLTRAQMLELPIVQGALRRRRRFASFDEAHDNFREKPPMSLMVPEVLRNYVDHGFREVDDGDVDASDGAVELRCTPELEAGIFVTGRDNGVWQLLPEISTPCLVLGGRVEERQPSAQSEAIARRLPNGEYRLLADQTHFGPFSHPLEVADHVAGFADS